MLPSRLLIILVYLFCFSSALAQHQHLSSHEKPAILLPGLGPYRHSIATKNEEAQKFFDQGLLMLFSFNRPEAVRSFRRATELDPKAAMPYWGLALALGRHLNMDMDMDVQSKEAYEAIQKALTLSADASAAERAYIVALAKRCSRDAKTDERELDSSYCHAMRELVRQYPDDADAAALYAESLMCLNRYQWFDATGKLAKETPEIKTVLEALMRRHPDHLLANHLYIHLLDTSPYPEQALGSAYRLGAVTSGAGTGHLQHMPSHIFMTLGDYDKTAKANERAILADEQYIQLTGVKPNIYTLGYYPHNLHMLVRAQMEQGRFTEAKQVANKLTAHVKPSYDAVPMMIDYFLPNELFVLLRFQRWDDILNAPLPDAKMYMSRALWHYGRALAFVGKGRRKEALAEQTAFGEARSRIPSDWMWMFNPPEKIMKLAGAVLKARLATNEQTAIQFWREAVVAEDSLNYDEPSAWYYPVRESLGGALLRAGQKAEAETVFRENLKRFPRNGRSLFGLLESLRAQSKEVDAEWVRKEFESIWGASTPMPRIEDF